MTTADIVLIALVAILAILGFFKGFYKSLSSFLGFFVSLLIAYFFAKAVAKALVSTDLIGGWFMDGDSSVFTFFRGKIPASLDEVSIEMLKAASKQSEIDAMIVGTDGGFISSVLIKICYPLIQDSVPNYLAGMNQGTARDIVAMELSFSLLVLLSGILLFIAVRLIAACINHIIGKRNKDKKKNPLGRLFGLAIGGMKGIVYAMIIITVLSFASKYGYMSSIKEEIDESAFVKPMEKTMQKINERVFKEKNDDPRFKRIIQLAGFDKQEEPDEPEEPETPETP